MNIDLLKIYENNKELEKEEEKLLNKKGIRKMIVAIIERNENYYTDNKELLDELGVKYSKCQSQYSWEYTGPKRLGGYKVKLTKENIKRIQKYLSEEK